MRHSVYKTVGQKFNDDLCKGVYLAACLFQSLEIISHLIAVCVK